MTSLSLPQTNESSNLLRNAMRADAVFGVLSGLFAIFDAGFIAQFMGTGNNLLYMGIGVALLLHSAALFYFSRSQEVPRWFVWYAIVADVLGIEINLLIIFTNVFGISDVGKWALFIVSDAVLAFAILKFGGLRHLNQV